MRPDLLKPAIFLTGLAVLGWIGAGYFGTSLLALAVVLLIAACYLAGGLELRRYAHATAALAQSLAGLGAPVPKLADWLATLPPALRHPVRQRIEGERVPLPAPALTPYLVGLLVLLGMLGTLLGMMTTLRGTGFALESATDLDAIRTSLAAPVKGLAFAFGASIAGVAASAMLGLLSALVRRDRAHVAQALDEAIATSLRAHTRAHQREEAFALLQRQVETMPLLVDRLQAMMTTIEQQADRGLEQQAARQAAFFEQAGGLHARLAASVEQSLKESVAESARAASATLQPVVETTLGALATHAAALHDGVLQATHAHLDAVTGRLQASTSAVAGLWTDALTQQREDDAAKRQALQGMLDGFARAQAAQSQALADTLAARFEQASDRSGAAWAEALARQATQADVLARRHEQALAAAAATFETHAASLVDRVQASHAGLRADLDTQARAQARETIGEVARLLDQAAEAPKAAAAVIAELRQNLSESLARDTAMLDERGRLLATVETLLGAVNHASAEQRAAVDALLSTSADALERVAARFTEHVGAETGRLDAAADRLAAGAVEVASLGEAFGTAVAHFGEANGALVERLQAVEAALGQSLARSDEQLAYYVAQAREVVDLSVLAQKQIIGELQQLARRTAGADAA